MTSIPDLFVVVRAAAVDEAAEIHVSPVVG